MNLTEEMTATDAIMKRQSIRQFRSDPVDIELVHEMLGKASRAANGCNFQPWQVHVVSGAPKQALTNKVLAKAAKGEQDGSEYAIQPEPMWDDYKERVFTVGKMMYGAEGIERDDEDGRKAFMARNFEFFGAPVGVFFSLDKRNGPNQWGSVGMFMQNFMLLAVEAGLATCPQEFWALYAATVKTHLGIQDDYILWSGMALGYADEDAPVNQIHTPRVPVDQFTTFIG